MATGKSTDTLYHEVTLVPALIEIQRHHGWLEREALERYAEQAEVPLHRLQAVASFFPHFRLTRPTKVVVKVCRDMACHMAGAAEIMAKLATLDGQKVTIAGTS